MSAPISETAVRLPAPPLRPFIARYAGFRVSGLPPGVHCGLPSSAVHLFISLGRPIEVLQMPNSAQRPAAFAALVSGMQDTPAAVRQESDAFGLHVFLRPLGVRAVLGVSGAAISSLVVGLSDIWGNRAGDLVERLTAAANWQERFAVLDQAFLAALRPAETAPEIRWAWRRLRETHGGVGIEQVAAEIGWSRWRLRERFRETVGATPKSAARVFRFERACQVIRDERCGLAQVAASCGYFDQAHLTREWNALAGCSPREWIARELPFLQDYEIGGCENERDESQSAHRTFV